MRKRVYGMLRPLSIRRQLPLCYDGLQRRSVEPHYCAPKSRELRDGAVAAESLTLRWSVWDDDYRSDIL